jgi:hypothetical protein
LHDIEPYYNWRDYYIASEDKLSPFYGRHYSEFHFTDKIYNHYIHPQWDNFGSSTLYCKVLYANYEQQLAVIELFGEWNDAIHNDIMELKRSLIDPMLAQGIIKFVLLGENVLNFHASDELYYEEWYDDIREEGGWILALNFREHVISEMQLSGLHHYLNMGNHYNNILWRKLKPHDIADFAENLLLRSLG